MGLIVKHADGSEFLNIANKTYDDVSTSLKLPGKGVLNWGEAYVNNFVHLLENFASSIEPVNPQVGQIWYNTGLATLSVYTIAQDWEVINKDTDIEAKFDALVEELQNSNAGSIPPVPAVTGITWFDTNINVLKVYNGTEWVSLGFNSSSSYLQPTDSDASDLWFDKNINNLKVHDGSTFQRIISTIESTSQPVDASVGQFWTNQTTGQMFIYKQEPSTGQYYWQELGAEDVTEGDILPTTARTGALHITRGTLSNILYVNKGTKADPIWTEIPEFGGAVKSVNEPVRSLDGMFWLDGNDILKVRKSDVWVDIDETAISYISDIMPASAKEGMVWFDTVAGIMKIKVGTTWEAVQNIGLIEYGVAPIAPAEGQLWYDNSITELKIYNGSSWITVNNSSTIVGYQTPTSADQGQFWLDTTSSELKVRKDGRWASLPEKARAYLSIPANPVNGDMVYVNNALKVFDGADWKDINISIDNSTTGENISVNYDEISHEIVITTDGVTTRVPLAVKRDVIVENVGITSDLIEVIHPTIAEGERRIIDIQSVNLDRSFFIFKNGQWTDNYSTDSQDLILNSANGEDEIDILQFNGDISINYLVHKFVSNVSGSFTIDNYTRTINEQSDYDVVKEEYDTKKVELIEALDGDNNSEEDLSDEDWSILSEIEGRFPIKTSNQIADLSLGAVLVFKEGIFIPTADLSINEINENKIVIANTNIGEIYTIIQLIAGNDYKAAFFTREHAFKIGESEDTTEAELNVVGKVMSDLLSAASKNTAGYGDIEINYTYDTETKLVTFDLLDIETDYHFFLTRNNLFVAPTNYTIDTVNNTLSMYANDQDDIRFFQFYLPHNYVPVEFNYKEGLATADGWITLDLNRDFDLLSPLLVYRNGILQGEANTNIITQETLIDDNGNSYTVDGLRKVQVFGDIDENKVDVDEPIEPEAPVAPLIPSKPTEPVLPTEPTLPIEPSAPLGGVDIVDLIVPVIPLRADYASDEEHAEAILVYDIEMIAYNNAVDAWNLLQEPLAPNIPLAPAEIISTDYVISVPPVAPQEPIETNYESNDDYQDALFLYNNTLIPNYNDAVTLHESLIPQEPVAPVEPIREDFATEDEYNTALNSYVILKDLYETDKLPTYNLAIATYTTNLNSYYSAMNVYHTNYEAFENAMILYNTDFSQYTADFKSWETRVSNYEKAVSDYKTALVYYTAKMEYYVLRFATYEEALAKYDIDLVNYTDNMLIYTDALVAYNVDLLTYETVKSVYLTDLSQYEIDYLRYQRLSIPEGILNGDIVTIMQVSQPEFYNIYLEEFGAVADGYNLFTFNNIDTDKDMLVFKNGMKIDDSEFYINADGKLVVEGCNGPTIEELTANPNAKGDKLAVYQFFTKDVIATDDLVHTHENIIATQDGFEYFQLQNTEYIADEFLLVFKNGQMITRKQPEGETTTQTQINTFKVFAERVYNNQTPALDANGDAILDSEGNAVINVDPDDYNDIMAFSMDNVVAGEEICVYEFNKKVTNVNNLSSENHYEILPLNNIQRIYTNKFEQLSNLTMIFQDGLIIDRRLNNTGGDTIRTNGMLRILDQYSIDNITKSVIVNDWKVGGKLRIQQFTAQENDIKTVTLSVKVAADGTYDIFLPNNETYTPNSGAMEVYLDRQIQWSGEDFQEVANNRIMFTRQLMKDQEIRMIIRK